MSEPRKNHLNIEGGQAKEEDHVASYKPIPEADTAFRSSKSSLHKSKEKVDEAEEKLLEKEDEAKIVTRVDMADAKYVVGDHRNGDAKIELDANKRQFSGLTKEELMKYADDPFWVRLRWAMFVLFWALWLCMLAGAIVIIVKAPKCAPPPPREWYQELVFIEASDVALPELEGDLTLFETSKVGGVFVKTECGADAYEVLKTPTCLDQFKEFVDKAKKHSVKVIVNLVANYVPTTHEWFTQSVNRKAGYEDYFIWRKSTGFNDDDIKKPPNNWVSVTNKSAWTFNKTRGEFYLSQYGDDKADLNFTNPDVVKQFDGVIKAWMNAGAAGVRLLNARLLLVSASFADELPRAESDPLPPRTGAATPAAGDYHFLRHNATSDQPELDGLLAHFSQVVDDNAPEPGAKKSVFTIFEDGSRVELYQLQHNVSALRPASAAALPVADLSKNNTKKLAPWPALQLTLPDERAEAAAAAAAFAHLLPAAPVLTRGQVARLNASGTSELSRLSALRAEHSIQHGESLLLAAHPTGTGELPGAPALNSTDKLFAVARWKAGHTGYVAVLNVHPTPLRANLSGVPVLADKLAVYCVWPKVVLETNNTINKEVLRDNVLVSAHSAVVLSFVPNTASTK